MSQCIVRSLCTASTEGRGFESRIPSVPVPDGTVCIEVGSAGPIQPLMMNSAKAKVTCFGGPNPTPSNDVTGWTLIGFNYVTDGCAGD